MKQNFTVLSSDKIHTLAGVVYVPEGETKGFFHVVHGMIEHIGRYDRFMQALCDEGYLCFGYDHLGHGKTAQDKSELGYIAHKNGDEFLCRDVKIFADAVMAAYSQGRQHPYYLMGHSMGSFITRLAVEKYVKPDKFIIMGTGGTNPLAGVGLGIIALIKALYGDRHISKLVYAIAFGSYNKRFGGGAKTDPSPWLTKDVEARKIFYQDPLSRFLFTTSAMGDLVRLTKNANRRAWFQQMPQDLPILLVAGDSDPVGNYGKGVLQVHNRLQKTGHKSHCILYPNARHEILNDDTYEQVKQDILAFIEA